MNQPDAKTAANTPAPAPATIPVETLIQSMKPEKPLVIEGGTGGFGSASTSTSASGGGGSRCPSDDSSIVVGAPRHMREDRGRANESDQLGCQKLKGRSAPCPPAAPDQAPSGDKSGAFHGTCDAPGGCRQRAKAQQRACWGVKGLLRVKACGSCLANLCTPSSCAFPIDLVYLDRKNRIKKVRSAVGPWRLSACLSAHSVLELPAGTIRGTQTQPGDTLEFVPLENLHAGLE